MSTIQLRAIEPDSDDEGSSVDSSVGLRFVALVDSGATHALRPVMNDSGWSSASPVFVSLACKETSAMRVSPSGTLLLPTSTNAQTTVPLGSVIQQLGYRLDWTATRCGLIAPSGRTFRLSVKAGCPEVVESEALVLISKLEQRRLDDLKVLEANVGESASRLRQSRSPCQRAGGSICRTTCPLAPLPQLTLQCRPRLSLLLCPWPVSVDLWRTCPRLLDGSFRKG